jgi:hypothetical protein
MSNEFFLDTAYAIALSVESDAHHQRAEEFSSRPVIQLQARNP